MPQELNDPADVTAALTFVQNLYPPHAPHALYHKRRPRVIISGQVLTSFLHNPPDVPRPLLLPDFEVDLGALFYALVRTPRV